MTCEETKQQLPGFQFGELPLHVRAEVEAHLISCLSCVGELVEFKRAVELSEGGPRPSEAARSALRDAIASELGLNWRWWERPVAFFLAASSVVFAVLLARPL